MRGVRVQSPGEGEDEDEDGGYVWLGGPGVDGWLACSHDGTRALWFGLVELGRAGLELELEWTVPAGYIGGGGGIHRASPSTP